MDNIYDILNRFNAASQPLMEGRGSKPDFLDLDRDGDRKEPMKAAAKQAKQLDELSPELLKRAGQKAVAQRDAARTELEKQGRVDSRDWDAGSSTYNHPIDQALTKRYQKFRGAARDAEYRNQTKAVAQTMSPSMARKLGMAEGDVEEGNDFTGARMAAIKAGKPTFSVDGKTYRVTGDTSDERVMEKKEKTLFPGTPEYEKRFPKELRPGERAKSSTGGTIEKTATGVKHTARYDDDTDADDDSKAAQADKYASPKAKGRPKGSKRAIGAKVKGTSKLHSKPAIREGDLEEDYDRDEYDEEGEMAMSQARTIEDAAEELQSILDADENLPEWVQKKITLAKEYIDSARDYLKANRPEEEMMAEKAVSKAQRAAAGIAYAAKKGDIPKSELRGASKEMAKMASGELKKFAKTKEKGLPEKKKEESVEETTVAGSVATSTETPKGKKGMIFGKGVYESQLAESFDKKLQTLTEGMSINMSVGEDGKKSLSVNASDEDAVKLAQILKLAGLEQSEQYHGGCSQCGADQGMCEHSQMEEGEYANSPDVEESDTDTMVNGLSGGLNGPKLQVNPNNMADNPLAMGRLASKGASGQLNLGAVAEDIQAETETRLMDLYKRIA